MFESLEIAHKISKAEFKTEAPALRERMIEAQMGLLEAEETPVILLLSGIDVLGRSECAKRLMSWLDVRHVRPYAMIAPSDEELARPRMWRFWQALPRKGRIGIFLNSWYEVPMRDYLLGRTDHDQFHQRLIEIVRFERMLAEEGAVIQKFLLYLPQDEALAALSQLKRGRKGAWKTAKAEREVAAVFANRWTEAMAILEDMVSSTSKGHAPWIPVASADAEYRDLFVGRTLVETMESRLASEQPSLAEGGASTLPSDVHVNILDTLDLSQSLSDKQYRRELRAEQRRLTKLTLSKKFEKRTLVVVFEGNDAAGKGGSIRRVVQALDPRMMRTIPIAAPSDEEKVQPYLWRFWRHMPRKGQITIFDRSWYGRLLVERVEEFCSVADWTRAYEEIRAFEAELADYGVIVVKFWLSIDPDEQLRRFEERKVVGHKRHKITAEDWRNREKWDDYAQAIHDMVDRTSTTNAPWTLVESNDKKFARVKVLRTLNDRLETELD